MSIVLILVSVFIFYFGVWKKEIYFGTEYNNFEFFFFLLISIICIGLVLFASLVRFRNRGNKTPIRTTAISLTIVVIFLIILFTGFPPPIVFHDAKLVHWVNTMPGTKKIAGYPEEMDTLGALTEQYFIMNLGQDRTSEDALNFYNFLNAYYAQNYSNVKEYLQSYGMDYLVVNTDYFPPNRSEKNSLFAFYSVLRDHEKQLRAISSQFALQNPSPKLIVLQTADHVIISAKALESALSDSTKFVGFYAK